MILPKTLKLCDFTTETTLNSSHRVKNVRPLVLVHYALHHNRSRKNNEMPNKTQVHVCSRAKESNYPQ